jgi:hypothetical protein
MTLNSCRDAPEALLHAKKEAAPGKEALDTQRKALSRSETENGKRQL